MNAADRRRGAAHNAMIVTLVSIGALLLLSWLLMNPPTDPTRVANGNGGVARVELKLYCAAGILPAVDAAIKAYEQEFPVRIQVNYDGSGTLLGSIEVRKTGDLYLAADDSYIDIAREKNLLDEAIPVARQRPVIAVAKGNPKGIHCIQDLLKDDVDFMLADPRAASIGKLTQTLLESTGEWEQVDKAKKAFKTTVVQVLSDVKAGHVDAAVVWDANVNQNPDKLEMVTVDVFDTATQQVTVGVLKSCEQPAAALHFCRYLQAPEKGQKEFQRYGYEAVDGDEWAHRPELLLFSGGVNRRAIERTLVEFQAREGVGINVQYNGCGILTALINGGQHTQPDLYFACDGSFMVQVQHKFDDARTISETPMVVIVKKGNPKGITTIRDLAQEGLKLGVANHEQSALGALTKNLFETIEVNGQDLYTAVSENVRVKVPTADGLVTQLIGGGLDAAVVYLANTAAERDNLEVISITEGNPIATQPIAVSKTSQYKHLAGRLINAIRSSDSQARFDAVGFQWRASAGEL